MKKFIGLSAIILGIIIALGVLYWNSNFRTTTREFASYTLFASSWEEYKKKFINEDGRVIDFSLDNITTSEGQSYALLRAVWMDDQETFDRVLQWTQENLNRPDDQLFGWKWGQLNDESYGFLPDGGENSASDGDQDIALALILASQRWSDNTYEDIALEILKDHWEIHTATAAGERYQIAGNWAQNSDELVINPSYFAPYAWRIFAEVDKDHDWESLIDPAYDLLEMSGMEELDAEKGVGLPPDWLVIDRETGMISASEIQNLRTTYSFDAIRVPWRIALDYKWNNEPRAKQYLSSSFTILQQEYENRGVIATAYKHDGTIEIQGENPSMYATAIGYFSVVHPELARKIYEEKIIRLYSNDQNNFREDLPYYEQNWLWFGAALYQDFLVKFD